MTRVDRIRVTQAVIDIMMVVNDDWNGVADKREVLKLITEALKTSDINSLKVIVANFIKAGEAR